MCGTRFENIQELPALFEITSNRVRGSAPTRVLAVRGMSGTRRWRGGGQRLGRFLPNSPVGAGAVLTTITNSTAAPEAASAGLAAPRPPAAAKAVTASLRTSVPATSNPAA